MALAPADVRASDAARDDTRAAMEFVQDLRRDFEKRDAIFQLIAS